MNWLTSQVPQMPAFASMTDPASGLTRVGMFELLPNMPGPSWGVGVDDFERELLSDGFALTESDIAATNRLAVAAPGGHLPPTFTLAIDDASGGVLYLPESEDDHEEEQLELFVYDGPRLSRLRASGDFSGPRPHIERVKRVAAADHCADGPCADWGDGCGAGCICKKYEIPPSSRFGRRRGRRYLLRCNS